MMSEQSNSEEQAAKAATNLPFEAVKTLSVNELRTAVETHLKQCGALNRLKTELRGMMLEGVLKETKMRRARSKPQSSSCDAARVNTSTNTHSPISSRTADQGYDSLENFEKMRLRYLTEGARNENEPIGLTTPDLIHTPPQPDNTKEKTRSVHQPRTNDINNINQKEQQAPLEEEEKEEQEQAHFAFQKWCAHVADALVAHHLRITQRQLTYSLFVNEAVVLPLTNCGVREEEDEVLRKMLLLSPSPTFIASSRECATTDNAVSAKSCENDNKLYRQIRMRDASRYSVLQSLIECNLLHQQNSNGSANNKNRGNVKLTCPTRTIGTQTEHKESVYNNGDNNECVQSSNGYAPLTTLEARLAAIDVKHALEISHLQRSHRLFTVAPTSHIDGMQGIENLDLYAYTPSATPLSFQLAVERRLETYKQEMHAQLRREYEMRYERFEREKLEQAKHDAAENFAIRISNMNEAMAEEKRALEVKLANERQALMSLKESLETERAQLLKSQRAMAEERMHYDEVNALQLTKLRESNEKMLLMQVKCAKWEELASSRLVELNQMKRKVESLSSHIERMYTDYAHESDVKNDEIARLQFRLRMLLTDHVEVNNDIRNKKKNECNRDELDDVNDSQKEDSSKSNSSNTIKSINQERNSKANVENLLSAKQLTRTMRTDKEKDNLTTRDKRNDEKNDKNNTNNYKEIADHNNEQKQNNENVATEIPQNKRVSHINAVMESQTLLQEGRENIEFSKERNRNDSNNTNDNVGSVHNNEKSDAIEVEDKEEEVEQKQEVEQHNRETQPTDTSNNQKQKQEYTSSNSSYASSMPSNPTQSSRYSSNIIKNEETRQNMSSSSSSSGSNVTASRASSASSKQKHESKVEEVRGKDNTDKMHNIVEQIKTQLNNIVNKEEVKARATVLQEEQQMWNSIVWTYKSQLKLIVEREKNAKIAKERASLENSAGNVYTTDVNADSNMSDSDDEVTTASPVSLFARMQRAEAAQERKNVSSSHNIDKYVDHTDDTDEFDDDEANELLFAKKSSSSSSSF